MPAALCHSCTWILQHPCLAAKRGGLEERLQRQHRAPALCCLSPILFAGGARAEAHTDRVRPPGRGDPTAAGGDQQHTRESSWAPGHGRDCRDSWLLPKGSWSPACGIQVEEAVNLGYLRGSREFLCLATTLSQADAPFCCR